MGWLKKLLGGGQEPQKKAAPVKKASQSKDAAAKKPLQPERATVLGGEACSFLMSLRDGEERMELSEFSGEDRAYISSMMSRVREGTFQVPVLPEAAIRIQQLMATPNVQVDDFVEVFKNDPGLSSELLKTANSAYYVGAQKITDIKHAIVRVGFNQIRALVVMVTLKAKVLRGGVFHAETNWIAEYSLAVARTCQALAPTFGVNSGEAFTQGLLNHVELFFILGMASEYSASKGGAKISREALVETVLRLGDEIFKKALGQWGAYELGYHKEIGDGNETGTRRVQIEQLGHCLLEVWQGDEGVDYSTVEGIEAEEVEKAVAFALR